MEFRGIYEVYEKAEKIIRDKLMIFCFQNKLVLSDMEYFMVYIKEAEENWDIRKCIEDAWEYSWEANIDIVAYILFAKAFLKADNILKINKLIKEKLGFDLLDLTIMSNFWFIDSLNLNYITLTPESEGVE